MIELTDVTVEGDRVGETDPPRRILEDVTLRLAERRICFLGANGSGKSTLLRLCNGLRTPTRGTVSVLGHNPVHEGRWVRNRVAFIFSDPLAQLLTATPVEDVELSLRSTHKNRKDRREAALARLRERGIEHIAHQSIYDISGGERQLTALTSVLAVEPDIIVADEPTTLLDLRNTARLRETFRQLPQQLLFATHDLEFARDAERVIVLNDGRVVADGEPEETIAWYRERMAQP